MHLYPIEGAVHRVPTAATAWNTRDPSFSMVIVGVDPDPNKAEALKSWRRRYWSAVHPFNLEGAHVNFMMDPAAAYRTSVRAASSACTAPGAMEATCHLSFGDYSGSEYASQLLLDTVIHGWDIAKATGQDTRLDPELVDACLPIAEQLTSQFRSAGVFGDNLPVGPDADGQTRLLAMMGRQP